MRSSAGISERGRQISEVLGYVNADALLVYGLGVPGQYGLIQSLTGVFPTHKGTWGLISPGQPPMILARDAVEASKMRRASGGAVSVHQMPARLADEVAQLMESRHGDSFRLAFAAGGAKGFPHQEMLQLQARLGSELGPDITNQLYRLLEVRTTDEVDAAAEALSVAEEGLRAVVEGIRIGVGERDLTALAHMTCTRRGAVTSLIHVSAGYFHAQVHGDARVTPSLPVTAFVEVGSQNGSWCEVGVLAVPDATPPRPTSLARNFVSDFQHAPALVPPYASFPEMFSVLRDVFGKYGPPTIGLGHTVGVDFYPSADDDGRLQDGMLVALHPSAELSPESAIAVANTFRVEQGTLRPLSSLPYHVASF